MTTREELAIRAPITLEDARNCARFRKEDYLSDDGCRSILMCIHAMLCFEWADAMILERDKEK